MKKIVYVLLLLHQVTLAMEEKYKSIKKYKSIIENSGLTDEQKILQCVQQVDLPQSIDPAIKEDISPTDPQAFKKIVRYSDMLATEFNQHSTQLVQTGVITHKELQASLKNFCSFKEDCKNRQLIIVSPGERNRPSFSVISKMFKERENNQTIEMWNVTKITALLTLDIIKTKEQKDI